MGRRRAARTSAPETTLCGSAPSDVCDAPDHSAGTSADCVAEFRSGVECRASAGGCDPAEDCFGDSPACPPDRVSPTGTVCRAATAACDTAESCDGLAAACPSDETTCVLDAGGADAGARDAATTTLSPRVEARMDVRPRPVLASRRSE